ncbi:glycoside hydrolase family 3 protein [Xylogone sp. PMI_703]|nr:glycoside hydrolase family 3 protein [Xylogone sp. PMI_703]
MQLITTVLLLSPLAQAFSPRQVARADVITDDTYFYGQSPPVYPTPKMRKNGSWAAAYAKAMDLINRMTVEEKVNVTLGQSGTTRTDATGGVPRLGFPGLCFNGATAGMKQQELVNGYPGSIHSGASWNREMNYARAATMAQEFKVKAYLAGQLAVQMTEGIGSVGVMSTVKHFIGYEQESFRLNSNYNGTATFPVSSNIDDRTMHELYLWPWADVIRAGAPCHHTINGLLKGELGFQGWVMTDWGALSAGYAAAEAGLDAVMPSPGTWWGTNGNLIVEAVKNGSMDKSRLDDMAARILTPWYYLGQDWGYTPEGYGTTTDFAAPHRKVYARNPASNSIILQNAMEGHVLVKNTNNALPLKKPQMVSVFGYDAETPRMMNIPNPANGRGWLSGTESVDPNGPRVSIFSPACAYNGTLVHAGGSETSAPAHMHSPFNAIMDQAYIDGTSLWWEFTSEDPWVNPNTDACLVFINAWATEGSDRPALQDEFSDNLVNNVAANCSNTMVFIHNAGIRLVEAWIDHPNVTAVMFAHLPGQDSGRSLAKLIYGEVSPSGKLPYTVGKSEDDYGPVQPDFPEGKYAKFPQSDFTEGFYIDYRWFDKHDITPRYEFGFGMTYTAFKYSNLQVNKLVKLSSLPERPPVHATQPGGNSNLWEVLMKVSIDVKNTGNVDAAEIAQLYVKIPGDDTLKRQLRGFDKKDIAPGRTKTMTFSLTRRDLSVWDVEKQDWVLPRGSYSIYVGSSSRKTPLTAKFNI